MFCTQCGNPNPDGAKNCVVCGAQLMGAPAEPYGTQQNEYDPYESTTVLNQAAPQAAPQAPSFDSYQTPSYDSYQAPSYDSYQAPAQDSYQTNNYYSASTPTELPGKGLGLASMIMGICSLLLCLGCWLFPVPVASIVLGFIAKSKAKAAGMKNSQATIGIVLSIIAIVAAIVGIIVYYVVIIAAASSSTPSYDYYDYYYYFINNFMM